MLIFIDDFKLALTLLNFDIGLVNESGVAIAMTKSVHFVYVIYQILLIIKYYYIIKFKKVLIETKKQNE